MEERKKGGGGKRAEVNILEASAETLESHRCITACFSCEDSPYGRASSSGDVSQRHSEHIPESARLFMRLSRYDECKKETSCGVILSADAHSQSRFVTVCVCSCGGEQ